MTFVFRDLALLKKQMDSGVLVAPDIHQNTISVNIDRILITFKSFTDDDIKDYKSVSRSSISVIYDKLSILNIETPDGVIFISNFSYQDLAKYSWIVYDGGYTKLFTIKYCLKLAFGHLLGNILKYYRCNNHEYCGTHNRTKINFSEIRSKICNISILNKYYGIGLVNDNQLSYRSQRNYALIENKNPFHAKLRDKKEDTCSFCKIPIHKECRVFKLQDDMYILVCDLCFRYVILVHSSIYITLDKKEIKLEKSTIYDHNHIMYKTRTRGIYDIQERCCYPYVGMIDDIDATLPDILKRETKHLYACNIVLKKLYDKGYIYDIRSYITEKDLDKDSDPRIIIRISK